MSKFYYQGDTYEVPPVEYCDVDIVKESVTRNSTCSCSSLLKSHACTNVSCGDCIFSFYNPEARLEYLKTKGILKMENNNTMPEIKGGMLVRNGSDWVLTANSCEGYVVCITSDGTPTLFVGTRINDYGAISEVYYNDADVDGSNALCVADIRAIMSGSVDFTDARNKNIAVWKRPDPVKEMTMAELEKHFGCKVKIVKES